MSQDWTKQDPAAKRESEKYDNPVPSREYILEFMAKWGAPISHPDLCTNMQVTDEDSYNAVMYRLKAMCRDGQLMSNRKNEFGILKQMDLVTCRVIGHRDGFGFASPEKGSDLFLSARQMRQVFDGDKVLVQPMGKDSRGRREGKIVEVLEQNTTKLVGRFRGDKGFGHLRSENQRITQEIIVLGDPDSELKYDNNQLVVVEITQQPSKRNLAQAKVVEVLGDHMAPGMEIQVAIHNYDIPEIWPEAVEQQIADLQPQVDEAAKAGRIDLRHLPLVTIDGEDARDFDDAVYAEPKKSGGWRLWVAIADVSHYVIPNTELDIEAHKRGNSVYFPDFVVPMLPEILSNGLCSLKPRVDRLALVCEMTISAAGRLSGYKFYEAVIQSHARLTYNKVATMLDDDAAGNQLRAEYKQVIPHLRSLKSLYTALRASREKRGAMDFDTVETRVVFAEDRKIEKIVPIKRNDAHKLIEECMLCANVATARFIMSAKMPSLYRVHDAPKTERLQSLRSYLAELGLELGGHDEPQPGDYQQLAASISERADRHVIQVMMLRSMSQAVYSPEEKGHFGLAYTAYTHFTSPIRRYPDLLVHRAIRSLIHSDSKLSAIVRPDNFVANPGFKYNYSIEQVLQLGEHCSMTERRADDATRDVMAWLKCEYMQSEVGSEFSGIVTAVTGFGLFVELKDVYIEGLIHITALPKDYYHFEAAKQRMIGERTRKVFRLGDQLNVKVVQVNLDDRKIDFELVSTIASAKKVRGEKKSAKTKAPAKQSVESQKLPVAVEQAPERAEDYSSSRKPAQKKPGRSDKLNVDQPAVTEHKTKRKPKKVKVKAIGDKVKSHLSSAEREIEQLNKGSKGVSNRAKKRKAKKVLKKSVKKQQS
ncbi:MAG: ribonuclease R [Oceanospirillaceae bacterium]|nr:ribonuclease R [Oceanospirillaceae bacterium]